MNMLAKNLIGFSQRGSSLISEVSTEARNTRTGNPNKKYRLESQRIVECPELNFLRASTVRYSGFSKRAFRARKRRRSDIPEATNMAVMREAAKVLGSPFATACQLTVERQMNANTSESVTKR